MNSLGASICRLAGAVASSGRQGRKLSILMYHRVLPGPDPLRPDEFDRQSFRLQMEVLSDCFNVLPLGRAVELLRSGTLPSRAVSITFDDGYADNATIALPILLDLDLTATFFVTTGFLDGGRMWNDSVIEAIRAAECGVLDLSDSGLGKFELNSTDQRLTAISTLLAKLKYQPISARDDSVARLVSIVGKHLPNDLMMTSDQVRDLADAGMTIGAHTVQHPILKNLSDEDAQYEIRQSREMLEQITGSPVDQFAYPNGRPNMDYDRRDVELLRGLGFGSAVSTAWGVCARDSDIRQLPRFTPWDRTRGRFALRMLHNYSRTSPDTVR